jgi:hypothetical protein
MEQPSSTRLVDPDSDELSNLSESEYTDDLLSRMFSMYNNDNNQSQEVSVDDDAWIPPCPDAGRRDVHKNDNEPLTLLGRMFERAQDPSEHSVILHKPTANGNASGSECDSHILARMFDTMNNSHKQDDSRTDFCGEESTVRNDSMSGVSQMSILQTREDAMSDLPLSSRMFDTNSAEDLDKINQYEFQSVIREIVSVRHSIRDHVIQLRQLRKLHRNCEETLHEMLQKVKQDGVRSCDYPLLFYMSRRTKRRVNKQVHQSEPLQTFMKSRGINMSDVERKDLISLIKKESYIKNTEGIIRSVPIDSR